MAVAFICWSYGGETAIAESLPVLLTMLWTFRAMQRRASQSGSAQFLAESRYAKSYKKPDVVANGTQINLSQASERPRASVLCPGRF